VRAFLPEGRIPEAPVLIRYYGIQVATVYKMLLAGFCFYSCIKILVNTVLQSVLYPHFAQFELIWQNITIFPYVAVTALWAAALAYIVQRRFAPAAAWVAAAAGLSAIGIIHAYKLSANGVESLIGWWVAPQFTLAYAGGALFLLACAWYLRRVQYSEQR